MSVKCPACKVENKDGAKFCKECGCSFSSLITCPSCSALIKPGKFCASCGHNFATPAPKADEISVPKITVPEPQEQTATTPMQASPVAVVEPVQPPAPKKDAPSSVVQPDQPPVAQVPKAMPTSKDDSSGSKTSLPSAEQPPRKANFKVAYALIPLTIVVALGSAYWWKSNHAETATAPTPAAIPAPATAAPAIPTVEPIAPEPTPAQPPAPEPVPTAKAAPVVPTQKQEPAKLPATTVKPVTTEKSPTAEKPVTPRPQMQAPSTPPATVSAQPKAEAPKSAALAKTLDEAYNERITAECLQGFFPGMACREKVRWQMCEGKWSPDALPGQTTCKGGGTK